MLLKMNRDLGIDVVLKMFCLCLI